MNHTKATTTDPDLIPLEVITQKIWAFEGVINYIHWGNNYGLVDIGQHPELEESGEQECEFRYMGQHWLANLNAYPNTDAGAHSAYAFCKDDLVIVLSMPLPPEEQTEDKKRKYVCVAVIEEDRSAVVKRWCWPLFRNLPSVVLGAKYATPNQESGFPFIDPYTSRDLVNPYTDVMGNERPLGTLGGTGNTRLVITREILNDEPVFVAHSAFEFMEETDGFDYVPDMLMQTVSNYKGRIVGFSAEDELLIDNIPVVKIIEPTFTPLGSDRSSTHKLIHIDEKNDIITIIFVTMDFHYRYYTLHPVYGESGFLPPPYAFHVRKAQLSGADLCIYKAMNLAEIPEITLETDLAASQTWDDMLGEPYSRNLPFCQYTWGRNLQQSIEVAYYGKDVELLFYGITASRLCEANTITNCFQEKKLREAAKEDAKAKCYKMYDIYKKSHGMFAW